MREIHHHRVHAGDEEIDIVVVDEPSFGGASHLYSVNLGDTQLGELEFQKGARFERGVNGITEATLIAILIDRLQSFQAGDYACRENALALTKLEEALHWLHHRTRQRMVRGVEGTNEP